MDEAMEFDKAHDVLWKRWLKALDKAERINKYMQDLSTELSRIQKVMKRNGIEVIQNKAGQSIFTDDEDVRDRARNMIIDR